MLLSIDEVEPGLGEVGPCDQAFHIEKPTLEALKVELVRVGENIERLGYTKLARIRYNEVPRMIKGKPSKMWVCYIEVNK